MCFAAAVFQWLLPVAVKAPDSCGVFYKVLINFLKASLPSGVHL